MCSQEPATCMSEVCVLRCTWQTREPPCILSNRAPSLQLTMARVGTKDQQASEADFTKEARNPKENKSFLKEKTQVQWLRLCASNAGGKNLIPDGGN